MRVLKQVIKTLFFLFIAFIVINMGFYTYAYLSPKLDLKTSGTLYLYDKDDNLLYQGSKTNKWTDLKNISPALKNAIIAVEDKNFYKHHGFDYLRIIKALFLNIKNNEIVQGASTISQQYIKNLYLNFDKTWARKIEEAFLTLELEVHYNKDEILEGYLNTINYGQGNYGIVNAAKYYFNKTPNNLTLEEAIILAGIPKNPRKFNPESNYENAIKRAKLVAKAMYKNDYITKKAYDNLFKEKIPIYAENKDNNLQMLMYYQDAVLHELNTIKEIPSSYTNSKGLKIYTNLDFELQKNLEKNILENHYEDSQVASIIVDPKTGKIKALTGGINYAKSQFNRAISSKRQVGSTMKPFLYYAALENNLTMSSTFNSSPTVFNLADGKIYAPTNANNIYANKDITMAAAVAVSDNIYAIKTNLFLGVDKMIEVANRCGIKEHLQKVASLPLGTSELNIIDFATGYTTFAASGYKKDLHLINRIEDMNGNILYEHNDKKVLVLNPNYTYILNEMLTSTTSSAFIDYATPTALNLKKYLTNKYAIKTGTTNTDYWIVGYNKDSLTIMWMGYDDNRPMNNKIRKSAKIAWAKSIEESLKNIETSWYTTPENVVAVPKDAITGNNGVKPNKTTLFYYVKGTDIANQDITVTNNN